MSRLTLSIVQMNLRGELVLIVCDDHEKETDAAAERRYKLLS